MMILRGSWEYEAPRLEGLEREEGGERGEGRGIVPCCHHGCQVGGEDPFFEFVTVGCKFDEV